jgi:hypothetical protein
MLKVSVKNFQAIAKASLELTGLTVITGSSNLGKTALFRAISGAFFGLPGDYYIRDGEDFTGVGVEDPDNDLKVIWRRVAKPTPNRPTALQVGDKQSTKIGTGHAQLTESTGVREITVTGVQDRVTPQFAYQSDQPFLLHDSPTTIAEILKAATRADTVARAQDAARKDSRQLTAKLEIREKDLADATTRRDEALIGLETHIQTETALLTVEGYLRLSQQDEDLSRKLTELLKLEQVELPKQPQLPDSNIPELLGKLHTLIQLDPTDLPNTPYDPPPPPLGEIQNLQTLITLTSQHTDTLNEIALLEQVQEEADREIKELEEQLGTCPTCSRPFNHHGIEGQEETD